MKGVLVIGHGSRAKETEATLETVLSMVKEQMPAAIIEYAFMELSERTVDKGIAALVDQGITEIKVVPYFLFMGIHLKEDIPQIMAECAAKFPELKVTIGEPLGADRRLAEILVDRIEG